MEGWGGRGVGGHAERSGGETGKEEKAGRQVDSRRHPPPQYRSCMSVCG